MEGYEIDEDGKKVYTVKLPQDLSPHQPLFLSSKDSQSFRKRSPKPDPLPISPRIKQNLKKRKKR